MVWVVPSVWSINSLISIYRAFWEPDTGPGEGTQMWAMSFPLNTRSGEAHQETDAQKVGWYIAGTKCWSSGFLWVSLVNCPQILAVPAVAALVLCVRKLRPGRGS